MSTTFIIQLLVCALVSLVLASLFLLGAAHRVKSGAEQGKASPIAKWLIAHRWAVSGASWGVAMYLAMAVTPAVINVVGGKSVDIPDLLIGVPICGLMGLCYGAAMSFSLRKRQKKSTAGSNPSA